MKQNCKIFIGNLDLDDSISPILPISDFSDYESFEKKILDLGIDYDCFSGEFICDNGNVNGVVFTDSSGNVINDNKLSIKIRHYLEQKTNTPWIDDGTFYSELILQDLFDVVKEIDGMSILEFNIPWGLNINIQNYKNLGITLPDEFYKYLQVNIDFAAQAKDFIENNKDINPDIEGWNPAFVQEIPYEIRDDYDKNSDVKGLIIIRDPGLNCPNTYITWYSGTNTYDIKIFAPGKYTTLKEILLHLLESNIREGEIGKLDELYIEHIKKNL